MFVTVTQSDLRTVTFVQTSTSLEQVPPVWTFVQHSSSFHHVFDVWAFRTLSVCCCCTFLFVFPVLFCCSDPVSPSGINKHHLLSLSASLRLTNATNVQAFVSLTVGRNDRHEGNVLLCVDVDPVSFLHVLMKRSGSHSCFRLWNKQHFHWFGLSRSTVEDKAD